MLSPLGSSFTIGELAKEAGVPTSTLRFYERKRLLEPSGRSASNYRVYTPDDLERLRFIRAAQATGFALSDVKVLLRPAACEKVQDLIERRLEDVSQRAAELQRVRRVLKAALQTCKTHAPSGRCQVVEDLSRSTRGPSRNN